MTKTEKRVEFAHQIGQLLVFAKEKKLSVMPFYFYRTAEEQARLLREGKSTVQRSKHQDWLAMDLVLVVQGELQWAFLKEYTVLGEQWEKLGGTWGGRWKTPVDPYHFEWKE